LPHPNCEEIFALFLVYLYVLGGEKMTALVGVRFPTTQRGSREGR